jgi:hypothetical protein
MTHFLKKLIENLGPAVLGGGTAFLGIKFPWAWPIMIAVAVTGGYFFGWHYGYVTEHARYLSVLARLHNCNAKLRATAGEILQLPIRYDSSWEVDDEGRSG